MNVKTKKAKNTALVGRVLKAIGLPADAKVDGSTKAAAGRFADAMNAAKPVVQEKKGGFNKYLDFRNKPKGKPARKAPAVSAEASEGAVVTGITVTTGRRTGAKGQIQTGTRAALETALNAAREEAWGRRCYEVYKLKCTTCPEIEWQGLNRGERAAWVCAALAAREGK